MPNQLLFLSRNREVPSSFRTGVSLHSHTKHSLEGLGFIGRFLQEHRILRSWIARQADDCKRRSGIHIDFNRAYWTPPLTAELAYELESGQIEALGLQAIVSLSDHDNIEAATLLRQSPQSDAVPVSVEWTVPFGHAVFHLGIHNMPPCCAEDLMSAMLQCTAAADERQILDLLHELREMRSLLIVFNHPVWNFTGASRSAFDFELNRFLQAAAPCIDAFELNGMRSSEENRRVVRLAVEWNQILISGGDRHACEPNGILNLTNAADFPEFIDEIRHGRQSTVLIMPQYQQPLNWRFYQGFTQVIRDYPEYPEGQRQWDQRTFHPDLSGEIAPLSELWPKGSPGFLKKIFALAALAAKAPYASLRNALSSGLGESLTLPHEAMPAPIDSRDERFAMPSAD